MKKTMPPENIMAFSNYMSELHVLFRHITSKTGFPPLWWSLGLHLILLKDSVNLRIDKLTEILLINVDYTCLYNLMCKKSIIPRADELDIILEEEFGSRTDYWSIGVEVYRRLFLDCIRQLRCPGELGAFDVDQCYKIIDHLFWSLEAQNWGLPTSSIFTLIITLLIMTVSLWTGYGDSDRSYGVTRYDLFQGVFKGNFFF